MNVPMDPNIPGSNHPSTTTEKEKDRWDPAKERYHRVEFWLLDTPYGLLRDIAKFEDRSMPTILERALAVYATTCYAGEDELNVDSGIRYIRVE